MSRQPRLNTSLRQQVYSYVETPIEMSPPGFPSHSTDITADQTTAYNDQISTTNPSQQGSLQTHPDTISVASQELEQARQMRLQERQALALSTTSLTEHPALSAPYAEENTLPQSPPTHSSSQYQSPPYSPGPLPEKRPPDFEYISPQKISITPDTNPLQSPRSPVLHRMGTFPSINQESQPVHETYPNHQPGQIAHPNQIVIGGHWSTGLCECTDIGTCCLGLSCPCILYGRTQYRLLRKSRGEDPTNLLGYETCNGSCTSMAVFCGCQWLLATIQHTRTRKAYDIEGNICSDCVRASCCMCCTFIRNEREIKSREENRAYSAQLTGSAFVTPYLPPGQMHYRPNSG